MDGQGIEKMTFSILITLILLSDMGFLFSSRQGLIVLVRTDSYWFGRQSQGTLINVYVLSGRFVSGSVKGLCRCLTDDRDSRHRVEEKPEPRLEGMQKNIVPPSDASDERPGNPFSQTGHTEL